MTQEDKQLLLEDLCGRLPYKVKCVVNGLDDCTLMPSDIEGKREIKPYLRPMSSMTEKEKKEYYTFQYKFTLQTHEYQELNKETFSEYLNWLNKKMFDYRGLIEKGLALEAPDGMYGKEE